MDFNQVLTRIPLPAVVLWTEMKTHLNPTWRFPYAIVKGWTSPVRNATYIIYCLGRGELEMST